ncbi:AI-2E family transporter [Ekhidna sp.]
MTVEKSNKEQSMDLSFQQIFLGIGCMVGIVTILYFGSAILIPISIALLISFILYPICLKIESWGIKRILATTLTMGIITAVLAGLVFLLSSQIASIAEELSNFEVKLKEVFSATVKYLNRNISLIPDINQKK